MMRVKKTVRITWFWALATLLFAPPETIAQYQPAQSSYSDFYNERLRTLRRPSANPAAWTYDQFYYHNPAVSPYMNLLRPSGQYTNNYYSFVRPEQQRRAAADVRSQQQRARAGAEPVRSALPTTVGPGTVQRSAPAATSGYQNHWYGGRAQLGL